MEDIYGRGGAHGQANNQYNQYNHHQTGYNQNQQFGQTNQFQNNQFQNNQFQQQQGQNQFQNYNQQDFQNQQNNSIYEHLTPQDRFSTSWLQLKVSI